MIAGRMSDSDFRDAIREVKKEAPDLRAEALSDAVHDRLAPTFDPDHQANGQNWADFWDLCNEYVQRYEEAVSLFGEEHTR